MIKLETTATHEVARRKRWVVLTVGGDRYLIDPAEAVALANDLVDASEEVSA